MTVMDLLMASRLLIRQFKELTCNLYSKTHKVNLLLENLQDINHCLTMFMFFCSIINIQFVLLIIRSANVTNPIKLMLNNNFF